jgi:hypothetical protein
MLRKIFRFLYLLPPFAYAALMLTILSFVLAWDDIQLKRERQKLQREKGSGGIEADGNRYA